MSDSDDDDDDDDDDAKSNKKKPSNVRSMAVDEMMLESMMQPDKPSVDVEEEKSSSNSKKSSKFSFTYRAH
eukprot:2841261-Ditylum_brightwellii.AAC.1